ncbi:MAG: peptidase M6 [Gemmatimonadota bacterium]
MLSRSSRARAGAFVVYLFVSGAVLAGCDDGARPLDIEPIDPQVVVDQDDMTWDHYTPIPGVSWADSAEASERTIRIALLPADFPSQPFVMTLPRNSDPFGNPQLEPVERDEIPQFYHDFWNVPGEDNRGHTLHEYWMELSGGRIGVEVVPYGPFRMEHEYYQYFARSNDDVPGDMQHVREMEDGMSANEELVAMWEEETSEGIRDEFDLVMHQYAGYDETTTWQEFGEMMFQTQDDISEEWGNPDPDKPDWVNTRYVDWTSWLAGTWLWANSAMTTAESSGAIRHEISHAAFRIGDNNNNPYVEPYRRVGAGAYDIMDRGSFNGPGGPHKRYMVPVVAGGAMPAGVTLRQRLYFEFIEADQTLEVNRNGLAESGLAVARVTARNVDPLPGELAGIVVRLDGEEPRDRTPPDDPAVNPLSAGIPDYDNYTVEVVQRTGYDSFLPDNGVLIAKNKDESSTTGGPNAFNVFNWMIDANPGDINEVDFFRPDGTPVMRTIADYRQLNNGLFHAGENSGSRYEWVDPHNRLHFYIVDVHSSDEGIRSYTLGVRSMDGSGPHERGVELSPALDSTSLGSDGTVTFTLTNTGSAADPDAELHPQDVRAHLENDIYRLTAWVEGDGWEAALPNSLVALPFGESEEVTVHLGHIGEAASGATVWLRATSESNGNATTVARYEVSR